MRRTLIVLAMIAADPAVAQPKHVKDLIQMWVAENRNCRGLPGDDPRSEIGCERRNVLNDALRKQGWCYGKKNEAGYQYDWHRCTRDSLRRS
jgi:hypothetical protein